MRAAIRQLVRRPAFAGAVIASLALGTGTTAAMFALTNALLLRPIGVADPDSLIRLSSVDESGTDRGLTPALLDALPLEEVLSGSCAVLTPLAVVELNGSVSARPAHAVSGACLEVLGARPAVGRLLSPADAMSGAEPVVVLTHGMWMREYAGRHSAIGETITVDGRRSTIVGVADAAFTGVLLGFQPDVVFPIARLQERASFAGAGLPAQVLGRLRPGIGRDEAQRRLQLSWVAALRATAPHAAGPDSPSAYVQRRLELTPAGTGLDFSLRRRFGAPLVALLCLSVIVLSTAGVNAANLLLSQSVEKRRQLAVRLALGASRWRIVRDELLESALLLGLGLGAGCVAAYAFAGMVVGLLRSMYSGLHLDITPDGRVLWLAGVATVVLLLAFGGWPAWRASAVDPAGAMGAGTRVAGRRGWVSSALVAGQIALAFTLIVCAAFAALAVGTLRRERPGLDQDGVVSVQLMPRPTAAESRPPDHEYYRTLLTRAVETTGSRGAALSSAAPLIRAATADPISALDVPRRGTRAEVLAVSGDFHRLFDVSIVAGRPLTDRDGAGGPPVAVISQSLAAELFGTQDPLGRRIQLGTGAAARSVELVGIARDAVVGSVREQNVRVLYLSFWQAKPALSPVLLVGAGGDGTRLAARLSDEILRLGRQYPARARTLGSERDAALLQDYLVAALSSAFAAAGFVVAGVGVYGMLAVAVARRRREIGIRQTLGANRRDILRMVLGWAFAVIGVGVAVGLPLGWAGVRGLSALLPFPSGGVLVPALVGAALLFLAGTLAALLPVWRTTRVEPGETLRAL